MSDLFRIMAETEALQRKATARRRAAPTRPRYHVVIWSASGDQIATVPCHTLAAARIAAAVEDGSATIWRGLPNEGEVVL